MKLLFRLLRNKYLLTAIFFATWMIFFDQDNLSVQRERKQQLDESRRNIEYLTKEIAVMEKEYYDLIHDPAKLEAFAREQYKMKRDNEDVYIIE